MNAKCVLLVLVLLTIGDGTFAQTPEWRQMPGSPSGTTRHDDIYFVNETNGWSARGRGGIFKTTDAGNTWVQKTNMPGTHFRAIGFLSPTRGFAGNLGTGSYDGNVTDTNVLYQTDDGGESWSVVPGMNETGMKGFCAIYVLDSQHIYGGGRVRGPAHFAKSEDGGTNWTVANLGTNGLGVMGGIMDVYFKDPMNGFVVGMDTNAFFSACGGNYHGRIAKTTDGGATWTAVAETSLACTYFWKMSWPTPDVGYVSLQQNGGGNNLIFYKTIDGGNTWISNGIPYADIGIGSFSLLQGIGFISPNEGWVGGPGGAGSVNNFLHTTNGGASWKPSGFSDSQQINRIRFYPNFAIASGSKLHIYKVPLAIAVPPESQTNVAGSTIALNVTAYGTPPLSYQWRFNGTNLAGATTNAYSITDFQADEVGNYDVVLRDYSGSVTSAVAKLSINGAPVAPSISTQPVNRVVNVASSATFSVVADGTAPLQYQWHFNNTTLSGATNTSVVLSNAQPANAGNYFVVVTNSAGSVTSDIVTLTVITTNGVLFGNDFDHYASPSVVTNVGTTNGYKIVYRSTSSVKDFTAIFGFDYSTVTFPTVIPPAPHSAGGTTKGLFLTVNKDSNGAVGAVNLYPTNQHFGGNFVLKFDMWMNWANPSSSTEHAMFGINHSGNVTNRVTQTPSDGLFFEVSAEGGSQATAPTLRDFSVLRGSGNGSPVLMTPNNTTFGPAPLLGSQFDNTNLGFTELFPAQLIAGYGTTPAGSAGLRWISGEVRQKNDLITWLLNGTIVAQYTNLFGYTNGTILLGYDDEFSSIGDANNFVIFDNVRVESIVAPPVMLLSPAIVGNEFRFSFATEADESYLVERTTNVTAQAWTIHTNLTGAGNTTNVTVPLTEGSEEYFRVRQP